MDIRATQLQCLRDLAKECQAIISRLDESLLKIKALSATIWSALCGWAITKQHYELILVSIFTLMALWLVAATFRGAQKRYICYSDSLHKFLINAEQLILFDSTGELPESLPVSLGGCEQRIERFKLWALGAASPTVSVFYGFFIIIAAAVYFSCR